MAKLINVTQNRDTKARSTTLHFEKDVGLEVVALFVQEAYSGNY